MNRLQLSPSIVKAAIAAAILATTTQASPIVFSAFDVGATSGNSRPLSNAAAAAFDLAVASLGTMSTVDFESVAVGSFANLTIAPSVTLSGTDDAGNSQTIRNSPSDIPDSLYGYNTTSGGRNFAYFSGGTMTFSFSAAVQAFGAYFSGTQLSLETITFNDGSTETIGLPYASTGGIAFVGFTDAGKQISSISINARYDLVGMDDVRFVTGSSEVPDTASTLALFGFSFLGLAVLRRRIVA